MLSINEDKHWVKSYTQWGWIGPDGTYYDGLNEKDMTSHQQYIEKFFKENISKYDDEYTAIDSGNWIRWCIINLHGKYTFSLTITSGRKIGINEKQYSRILNALLKDLPAVDSYNIFMMSGTSIDSNSFINFKNNLKQFVIKKTLSEVISHTKKGWTLKSKTTGRNLGGPYKTKGEAIKREGQVQYFKNLNEEQHVFINYHEWGWFAPDGTHHDGQNTENASYHQQYLKKLTTYKTETEAYEAGYVRYSLDRQYKLALTFAKGRVTKETYDAIVYYLNRISVDSFELDVLTPNKKFWDYIQEKNLKSFLYRLKTFLQPTNLNEQQNVFVNYIEWGWIDPDGKIYDGNSHSKAKYHRELLGLLYRSEDKITAFEREVDALKQGWIRWALARGNIIDKYQFTEDDMVLMIENYSRAYSPNFRSSCEKLLKMYPVDYVDFYEESDHHKVTIPEFRNKFLRNNPVTEQTNDQVGFLYRSWGFITSDGEILNGQDHEDAKNHDHLLELEVGNVSTHRAIKNMGYVRWALYKNYTMSLSIEPGKYTEKIISGVKKLYDMFPIKKFEVDYFQKYDMKYFTANSVKEITQKVLELVLISEGVHLELDYKDWGLLTPDGKNISGQEHGDARTHRQLINYVTKGEIYTYHDMFKAGYIRWGLEDGISSMTFSVELKRQKISEKNMQHLKNIMTQYPISTFIIDLVAMNGQPSNSHTLHNEKEFIKKLRELND